MSKKIINFAPQSVHPLGEERGNQVRNLDSPAAVSRPLRSKHNVTEIIGKTFVARRQVRIPADKQWSFVCLWG